MSIHSASFRGLFAPLILNLKRPESKHESSTETRVCCGARETIIVDDSGALAGIITRGDVLRAIEQYDNSNLTVMPAGSGNFGRDLSR